jgi:hypothetical protein
VGTEAGAKGEMDAAMEANSGEARKKSAVQWHNR